MVKLPSPPVSDFNREFIVANTPGMHTDRLHRLYNGIDLEFFNPRDRTAGAVARGCPKARAASGPPGALGAEARRRTHRTSRLIAKLRGHGLIAKIKDSRLYRLTRRGVKAMWPAVRFRHLDFPAHYLAA